MDYHKKYIKYKTKYIDLTNQSGGAKNDDDKKKYPPSTLTYKYVNNTNTLSNGKKTYLEENLFDGPKGVSFKYYNKVDDVVIKYAAKQEDDMFLLYTKENDKEDRTNITRKDLMSFLKKKAPMLNFVVDYLKKKK